MFPPNHACEAGHDSEWIDEHSRVLRPRSVRTVAYDVGSGMRQRGRFTLLEFPLAGGCDRDCMGDAGMLA